MMTTHFTLTRRDAALLATKLTDSLVDKEIDLVEIDLVVGEKVLIEVIGTGGWFVRGGHVRVEGRA